MSADLLINVAVQKRDTDHTRIARELNDFVLANAERIKAAFPDPDWSYGAWQDGEDDMQALADYVVTGYETIADRRTHVDYWLQGTDLSLWIGGGMSWGVEPYDGFHEESDFLELCATMPEIAELTDTIPGPPTLDDMIRFATKNEENTNA